MHVLCVADGELCPSLKENELARRQEHRDKVRGRKGRISSSQKVGKISDRLNNFLCLCESVMNVK